MEPVYDGTVHIFQGRFFSKWKRFKGAIFEENMTGECVAIRIVHFRNTINNDNRIIQIQPRNAPVLLIAVENVEEWHYVLCKVAFPDQFASIGTHPSSSLSTNSNDEYDAPWDLSRIPVLLESNKNIHRMKIPEGNYEISFGDSIFLKNGFSCIEAWSYPQITWFGTGENCFAFEVDYDQPYEFKCGRPENVLEALQQHIKLKTDTALPTNTCNVYTKQYVPAEQKLDRSSSERQMQRPSLRSTLSFRNERSVQNSASSDSRSRFPFFRLKKEWKEREKFELDAKDEWIRYSKENLDDIYNNDFYQTKVPEKSYLRFPNMPNAIAFQRDLKQTIAKRALCLSLSSEALSRTDNNCSDNTNDGSSNSHYQKVILRPRVILDGDLLDPSIFTPSSDNLENDSGVGSLQARIRDSVVSAPSPSPITCNPSNIHTYFRQSLIN
ncbi:Docking protein [Dirofilaria immitis]